MDKIATQVQELCDFAVDLLDTYKAFDITILDVRSKTCITDLIVIANCQSVRQTKAIASHLTQEAKEKGYSLLGVEGEQEGKWVLVDLGDVVVHLMLPATRVFYQLEKLWQTENRTGKDALKTKASG